MYPLKFEHIYVNKVWGGRNLESFREDLPEGKIGESWEVACRKDVVSIISNGKYKGMSLDKLILKESDAILGTKISNKHFPLLIKFLDAQSKLSIQVHPNDFYALQNENDLGKTEAWVVLDAQENASMVLGVKDCSPDGFKEALEKGDLEPYLNRISVKKGDVYFIQSGLIHTMEGVLVAEIQQNSDTTYRVYDYNRGRELHIKKAMDVIDFSIHAKKASGLCIHKEGYEKTYYCYDHNFSLEKYKIEGSCIEKSDKERFYIFICIDGEGLIRYSNGIEEIRKGDTVFIPAGLGAYTLDGNFTLLKAYVPNIEKLEKEILGEIKYLSDC
ncbi:mannose-6-phosphate isomerase, class I [Crassaminicella indica]|uniref:Phosphohexomutase n=1 Tax=Crassaminicella indica TaxID=2855394 RepID=A0ABX8R8I7_9CLOT|nr:mannose-6-phosphate isomerase, class I [Crassaminicella indica]QXM05354.1 mannose-6-phosphate isomerase, class I [Crassaminicella indica]